ncbi:hypothetical protein C3L33_11611, partial [Rhododendron williamsianum]
MEELFVAILSMLLLVALIPLYLWKRRQAPRSPDHAEEDVQVPQREAVVRATGNRRMRRRPASAASTSSAPIEEEIVDGSDDEAAEGDYYNAKASKKKDKKRQEREAQRQAEEASRDSRHTKQDRYAEMRRQKDEEREALERQQEEEAMARKAKEEEAASLEFEKWKGDFSVDAEGTTENEVQDGSQGLLFDFVEYIKKHKCIPLEDLAAEFKLRTQTFVLSCKHAGDGPSVLVFAEAPMLATLTSCLIQHGFCLLQDCINRINSLENMGRLSGVMDDRGKYIYISLEEMQAVADYIKRQGRVSISHLASQSNQFIDLEPKAQFVEEISSVEEITAA